MTKRDDDRVTIEEIEEARRRAEGALTAINALLKRLREQDSGAAS